MPAEVSKHIHNKRHEQGEVVETLNEWLRQTRIYEKFLFTPSEDEMKKLAEVIE